VVALASRYRARGAQPEAWFKLSWYCEQWRMVATEVVAGRQRLPMPWRGASVGQSTELTNSCSVWPPSDRQRLSDIRQDPRESAGVDNYAALERAWNERRLTCARGGA
jgi:hypothetical protein